MPLHRSGFVKGFIHRCSGARRRCDRRRAARTPCGTGEGRRCSTRPSKPDGRREAFAPTAAAGGSVRGRMRACGGRAVWGGMRRHGHRRATWTRDHGGRGTVVRGRVRADMRADAVRRHARLRTRPAHACPTAWPARLRVCAHGCAHAAAHMRAQDEGRRMRAYVRPRQPDARRRRRRRATRARAWRGCVRPPTRKGRERDSKM